MLNKVMLIGNMGADPEVRYMPSGGAVATISLATTRRWKDKQSGERKEETEWHRVTFWGKLAEIVEEYTKKGSKLHIEGRIKTTKWQKDGVDTYSTGIVGEQLIMLDSKSSGGSSGHKEPTQGQPYKNESPDDFDDDIPFN